VYIETLIFYPTKLVAEISEVNLLQTSQMSSMSSGRLPLYPHRQLERLNLNILKRERLRMARPWQPNVQGFVVIKNENLNKIKPHLFHASAQE
jgi:hypothetical protein